MRLDEGGELVGDAGVLALRQAGPGQRLERGEPTLVEAGHGAPGEPQVGDLSVRGAPPQRQSPFEQVDRPDRVARPGGLVDEGGELVGVDGGGVDRQRVARRGRHHECPGSRLGAVERPAELRHLRREQPGRVGAVGALAPQVVDEPVGRDRFAPVHHQVGQQGPHLGPGDGDRSALVGPRRDRPEHAEAHPRTVAVGRPDADGVTARRQDTVNRPSTQSDTVGHDTRNNPTDKDSTMGKIVNSTYMTLDGDITNMQDWHFEFWGDEASSAAAAIMGSPEALIMGRKTYDGFYPAWSAQSGEDNGADRMNSVRKYVVSNTLTDPEWTNTTVISGDDVAAQIRTLKDETDGDLLQYGFGDVTRLLLAEGLLDELKIWLHPVISGKATADQLIYRDMAQAKFRLTDTDVHSTGVVILSYAALD